ncbi:hypothetical protein BBP40_006644 [Aspergillus hancockii]|nr:hypothetical protein BBP40_006644 [Aspergillus hancockii]
MTRSPHLSCMGAVCDMIVEASEPNFDRPERAQYTSQLLLKCGRASACRSASLSETLDPMIALVRFHNSAATPSAKRQTEQDTGPVSIELGSSQLSALKHAHICIHGSSVDAYCLGQEPAKVC